MKINQQVFKRSRSPENKAIVGGVDYPRYKRREGFHSNFIRTNDRRSIILSPGKPFLILLRTLSRGNRSIGTSNRTHLPVIGLTHEVHLLANSSPKQSPQYGFSSLDVKRCPASEVLQWLHVKHSLCHGSFLYVTPPLVIICVQQTEIDQIHVTIVY